MFSLMPSLLTPTVEHLWMTSIEICVLLPENTDLQKFSMTQLSFVMNCRQMQ